MYPSATQSVQKTFLPANTTKRLAQDLKYLQDNPIVNANAAPIEDNLCQWKCCVVGSEGTAYAGIPIYFVLEFTEQYPIKAPHAYFLSQITYRGGASLKDDKGRTVVCLDLFGNFGAIHSEWGKDNQASGWSPAYNVATILVQMQAMLASEEYLSTSKSDIDRLKRDQIEDKYLLDVPKEAKSNVSSDLTTLCCYMTKCTLKDKELFGYGINVNEKNGMITSPCEYLSKTAYDNGVRVSTTNQVFKFWLPLYVNDDHWKSAKKLFYETITQIYKTMNKPKAGVEEMAVYILSSAMNNSVVEVMNAKNNLSANDKFIDGYFNFYRLLMEVKKDHATIVKSANSKVEQFLVRTENRSKTKVANLGDWLILLLISDKYKWNDVAEAFVEECDARNVFWYVQGSYNSRPMCPELADGTIRKGRCEKVFTAAATSRNLVCFQTKFLSIASQYDLKQFDERCGLTDDQTKQTLKNIYIQINDLKTWNDYFQWNGMKQLSEEERCDQLLKSLKLSQEKGYHGKKK